MSYYVERGPRGKWRSLPDDDYTALLDVQGGGCAICGATPKTRRLHVDHDHRTGQVRGLLCHRCNRALATWVSARWLIAAALYLLGRHDDARGVYAMQPTDHVTIYYAEPNT